VVLNNKGSLLLQLHCSNALHTELFKPSKDSATLQVCNEKKIFGFGFFVNDVISKVGFQVFNGN